MPGSTLAHDLSAPSSPTAELATAELATAELAPAVTVRQATPVAVAVPSTIGRVVTALIIVGPGVALGIGIPLLWGRVIHLQDVVLAVVLYVITGHGISVGYHRLFAHRSFRANRLLKIALASAGSLAVEGSVIGWVATHRHHHVRSDQSGDPHSPWARERGANTRVRGFLHAHVGWLFRHGGSSPQRYASDLMRDRDLVTISKLFPVFALASFALPFGIGFLLTHSVVDGLRAMLWAGLVRMLLLHHVTWSINSVCHMVGRRPFASGDRSTNVAPLALLSFGESFHNFHHADPSSARHGALPGQIDTSAGVIRIFERLGWATEVRWANPAVLAQATPRR